MGYTMEDIMPAYTEVVSQHSKFTLKLHYKTNQYRNDKNGCYENYYWLSVVYNFVLTQHDCPVTTITLLDTK